MGAAVGPAVGLGMQGVQAITSGVSGKKAQKQLDNQISQTNQAYTGMMDAGSGAINSITDFMNNIGSADSPGMMLYNQAGGIGGNMNANAEAGAAQIGAGGYMDMARDAANNQFDFQPVNQHLTQTTQLAQDMAGTARSAANDQMALAMNQGTSALDAQLAGRGLSRNSGAGAAGLMGLHQQNAMASAQLEGQLSNQAGQMALGAAQLDSSNLLQQQGMASQYNLGMNQLGANVGMGLQQMNDQQALSRAGLLNSTAMDAFNLQQGAYQGNILNPQMQMQNILGGLAGSLAGIGAGGLQSNTGHMAKGVESAGSGKGAAMGGIGSGVGGLSSAITGKNNAPTAPAASVGGGGGGGGGTVHHGGVNMPTVRFD